RKPAGDESSNRPAKKIATEQRPVTVNRPVGLRWDSNNYSCAYDALWTAVYHIWLTNPYPISWYLRTATHVTSKLVEGFVAHGRKEITLEAVRDAIRRDLHSIEPRRFRYGAVGCSVEELANMTFDTDTTPWIFHARCRTCNRASRPMSYPAYLLSVPHAENIAWFLKQWLLRKGKPPQCCNGTPYSPEDVVIVSGPHIACLAVTGSEEDRTTALRFEGAETTWRLASVVYHGSFHFVMRHIDPQGNIWFHDGM
ncbi:hypothetical protein EXIGLDRAFT_585187, partial [Exidia glandulosa HHB12029]